jgi:hypothetical protein
MLTKNEAVNKRCPYAFIESLGDFIYCLEGLCLAWKKIDDNTGYCQRLNSEENIHVRYRPIEG